MNFLLSKLLPDSKAIAIDPTGRRVFYQLIIGFRLMHGIGDFLSVGSINLKDAMGDVWWELEHTINFALLGTKTIYHRTRSDNTLYRYTGPIQHHYLWNDYLTFDLVHIHVTGYDTITSYAGTHSNLTKYTHVTFLENALGASFDNRRQEFNNTYALCMDEIEGEVVDLDNSLF